MTKWTKLIAASVLVLASIGLGTYIVSRQESFTDKGQKPTDNSLSSFESQSVGYECSKEINGEHVKSTGQTGQPIWTFIPDSPEDLKKYCRTTYVIEYHAVLDILKRPDVSKVIDRYDSTEAWVKALNYTYIQNEEFIKTVLPDYSSVNIECIVVVHSPGGTRFFLEDGDTEHSYIEIEEAEFLASLNNAGSDYTNQFWLNLR